MNNHEFRVVLPRIIYNRDSPKELHIYGFLQGMMPVVCVWGAIRSLLAIRKWELAPVFLDIGKLISLDYST